MVPDSNLHNIKKSFVLLLARIWNNRLEHTHALENGKARRNQQRSIARSLLSSNILEQTNLQIDTS